MNPFKAIGHALASIGRLIGKAVQSAAARGLTDEILQLALTRVKVLAGQQLDNSDRREYAVRFLMDQRVPESIARLAVEMAVSLAKHELAQLP